MPYDRFKHRRRSIRLKGYDYSRAGAYFVTICLQGGQCLLGQIVDGAMQPNAAGMMIDQEWFALSGRFPSIELDEFVVMPNHIHGIISIHEPPVGAPLVGAQKADTSQVGAPLVGAPGTEQSPAAAHGQASAHGQAQGRPLPGGETVRPALGQVMGAFKSITTVGYIRGVKRQSWPSFHKRLWQRNYYEHIIRNERELQAIRKYILNNPASWQDDSLHPQNPKRFKFLK